MKTSESPLDLDSLLDTPVEVVSDQSVQATPPPVAPVVVNPFDQVAPPMMESRWESDEILDIPRTSAGATQHESPLAVEDLLAAQPVEEEEMPVYQEPSYTDSVLEPVADTAAAAGFWGATESFAHSEEPLDLDADQPPAFDSSAPSPFAANYADEAIIDVEDHPEQAAVFAQDSYVRSTGNTYVMATPHRTNKGQLAKLFLFAALAFALLGVGYFALSGPIKDWLGLRGNTQTATNQNTANQAGANPGTPGTTPSTAPRLGAKVGAGASPQASPSAAASPVATASAKPTASAAATPPASTPGSTAANQNPASKPTPTPAAAQTGISGHAVGSGDGSLAIQIASYKTPGEAQQRIGKLKGAGIEARMVKADVPGKGIWYRVQSGRFTNEGDASKYAGELRAKGVARDFIVTGYQNE